VPVVLDDMVSKFFGLLFPGYAVYMTLLTAGEGEISKYFLIRVAYTCC
jgi:hypothetical protein